MDIKNLTLEQKKLLLAVLESQIGVKLTDTEAKEDPFLAESRKCNEIARLKKLGKSVIYTELQ
jgi:uncharacterized protein with ATP-grasp and redox domains